MAKTVNEAKADLAKLESFKNAVSDANTAFRTAEFTGDPAKISAAQDALAAAIDAERASGVTDRDIALASQAVLDATGQAHTEENISTPPVGTNEA